MAQKKKAKTNKNRSSSKNAKSKSVKYVYDFGKKTDGDAKQRELLGGKGANLAEMARIGLPVPPGFTITTEVCTYFYGHKRTYPKSLDQQIRSSVALMEKQLGKKLGDKKKPLLLSVIGKQQQGFLGLGEKGGPAQRTPFFPSKAKLSPVDCCCRNFIIGCIVRRGLGC